MKLVALQVVVGAHGARTLPDAQFDWNEKFPRPNGTVRCFAKFWPKSLIRKSKWKRSVAEAQMT